MYNTTDINRIQILQKISLIIILVLLVFLNFRVLLFIYLKLYLVSYPKNQIMTH